MADDARGGGADAELIARVRAAYPSHEGWLGAPDLAFHREPIACYPGASLLVARLGVAGARREVLYVDDGASLHHLDGRAEPVFEANEAQGLRLGEGDVADYVRFFFRATGDARLRIVEDVDDIPWSEDADTRGPRASCQDLVAPLAVVTERAGVFTASLTGVFDRLLVRLHAEVSATGDLTPKGQDVLVEDLPTATV